MRICLRYQGASSSRRGYLAFLKDWTENRVNMRDQHDVGQKGLCQYVRQL